MGTLALQTGAAGFEAISLHEPHESQSHRCSSCHPTISASWYTYCISFSSFTSGSRPGRPAAVVSAFFAFRLVCFVNSSLQVTDHVPHSNVFRRLVLSMCLVPDILRRCPAVRRLRASQLLSDGGNGECKGLLRSEAHVLTDSIIAVLGIGDSHQRHQANLEKRLLVGHHLASQFQLRRRICIPFAICGF